MHRSIVTDLAEIVRLGVSAAAGEEGCVVSFECAAAEVGTVGVVVGKVTDDG